MNKLIINTKNLITNIKQIKQKLKDAKFCAVVKADAYGHGIENIVPFIDSLVDCYAVAKVAEGKLLRGLTSKDILVLGAFESGDIKVASLCDLILSVYSLEVLKELIESQQNINVHIKINSGMNRLGLSLEECKIAKALLDKNCSISVTGIYSHIFDNNDKQSVQKQREIFDCSCEIFGEGIITHLSSTGGLGAIEGYKMARVGLGIYGYPNFLPVMSIESKVAKLTPLKQNDKVSYEGLYSAKEGDVVATIPMGYYDGVPLNLYQGGYVIINNQKCSVVGKVCMDMFMCKVPIDVSVGDKVQVFWSASPWAKIKGSHEWEILTSIKNNRLKVVFRK